MAMSSINYSARTEGQIRISTIKWAVKNVFSLLKNIPMKNKSREIKIWDFEEDSKREFRLKIKSYDDDTIQIAFQPTNAKVSLKSVLKIHLKSSVTSSLLCNMEVANEHEAVTANNWTHLTTLHRSCLRVRDQHTPIISLDDDGVLLLKCQFMVKNDIKINDSQTEAQLSDYFDNLLHSGLFSDVIIKSMESVEYKAHTVVLARSAVLKALFEHNMIESRTKIIESPLESEILREVLTFIYSDKAPRLDEIPEKLLSAADYYQLTRLKCLCEEALQKKLTVENAIDTLQLADLHSSTVLKEITLQFIKENGRLITQTESWSNIKSVELMKTISQFLMSG